MANTYASVLQALRQRFVTGWGTTTVMVFDNEPVTNLDVTKAWTRFVVRPNVSERVSFGDAGVERKMGILVGTVFVPKGSFDGDAYDLADSFASIFRNWRSADGVIKCDGETRLNINDSNGDWFSIGVTVEWECEG